MSLPKKNEERDEETQTWGDDFFTYQPQHYHKLYKNVTREITTFAARARIGHIIMQEYLFWCQLGTVQIAEPMMSKKKNP